MISTVEQIERHATLLRETEKAYLFRFIENHGRAAVDMWIPKTAILNMTDESCYIADWMYKNNTSLYHTETLEQWHKRAAMLAGIEAAPDTENVYKCIINKFSQAPVIHICVYQDRGNWKKTPLCKYKGFDYKSWQFVDVDSKRILEPGVCKNCYKRCFTEK